VNDRGFFAGPEVALQLDLIDRATGQVIWTKAGTTGDDPRDGKALERLLHNILAGQDWVRWDARF
jgi:hypothetical protein